MKIGNSNGYNYAYTLAQRNKAAAELLLNDTNKKNQPLANLMDVFTRSSNYNFDFGYADLLKKGNANKPSISDSLRIDPSQPLQKAPEIEYVQMEHVTKSQVDFKTQVNDRVKYSEMFLGGLGDEVFNKFLEDKGITLPKDAKFDISVDGYGAVTVSGLEDEELTSHLQDAMSYDFTFIRSTLLMFEESRRTIESKATDGGMGMSKEQHWKMKINADLTNNYGKSITDLSLDSSGKIQGLPEELHNKIYGSRAGMSEHESMYYDFLRDTIVDFAEKGLDNIPTYESALTYSNGKITTKG